MSSKPTDWSTSHRLLARSLPEIYRGDLITEKLLHCFETVLFGTSPASAQTSLWARLHATYRVSEPALTPSEFLPWLAGWLGLTFRLNFSDRAKRLLLENTVYLYQWRGTRSGIERVLQIVTECDVQVTEPHISSLRVGREAVVGKSTRLGREMPHRFHVAVQKPASVPFPKERLDRMTRLVLDNVKPAHTIYTLVVTEKTVDTSVLPERSQQNFPDLE